MVAMKVQFTIAPAAANAHSTCCGPPDLPPLLRLTAPLQGPSRWPPNSFFQASPVHAPPPPTPSPQPYLLEDLFDDGGGGGGRQGQRCVWLRAHAGQHVKQAHPVDVPRPPCQLQRIHHLLRHLAQGGVGGITGCAHTHTRKGVQAGGGHGGGHRRAAAW